MSDGHCGCSSSSATHAHFTLNELHPLVDVCLCLLLLLLEKNRPHHLVHEVIRLEERKLLCVEQSDTRWRPVCTAHHPLRPHLFHLVVFVELRV